MRFLSSIATVGMCCLGVVVTARAAYTDTVDIGQIPADIVSLRLYDWLLVPGTQPGAQAQYSNAPQTGAGGFGGSGPLLNGVVSGSAGGTPTFIYEFSSRSPIQISGFVDGPFVNFSTVQMYSGTPRGPSTLISTGTLDCACGPEQGGSANTALSGGGKAANYYLEFSDPTQSAWESPKQGNMTPQLAEVGDALFTVSIKAPEISPVTAASALTLLLACLAMLGGRAKGAALRYRPFD